MKPLTDYQKRFILDYFFKNENYAGWANIADKLLETGQCIVAGEERIWKGGVGNFIDVVAHDGSVGCSLYVFRRDDFLSSVWFKEVKSFILSEFHVKRDTIHIEITEIDKL
jgi:hypothetical protein